MHDVCVACMMCVLLHAWCVLPHDVCCCMISLRVCLPMADFTVVSMSTVGYGDIYPVSGYTRLLMAFLISVVLVAELCVVYCINFK